MARTLSDRALACIMAGPTITTRVTVTKPGADPVELETAPGWEVSEVGPIAGTRLTISSIQFLPTAGVDDLFVLVSWPGAVFDAAIGINLGGGQYEYIPVFQGRAVSDSSRRNSEGVTAALSDHWFYYDRIPYTEPLVTTTDTRANLIGQQFTALDLGVSVIIDADGGTVSQAGVYTNTRGQAATDLAADGKLQAGFDGDGDLVIKAQPDLSSLAPVWTFRSGTEGPWTEGALPTSYPTIVGGTLERTRALADALVNAVAVIPSGEWQTWSAQIARLTDPADPYHEDAIGLRGVEVSSSTIDNACDALLLAKNELTRRRRVAAETVRVTIVINPAVEVDDVAYLAALPVLDDPGWNGAYICTSVTHAPAAGTTTIEAVSASAYSIGM